MFEDLVTKAFGAARDAADKLIQENPGQWYPCGFVQCRIRPASGPLVKYLKENGLGKTGYDGGFVVYNPSNNHTQWMDAKEAGARAFKSVLSTWLQENPQKTQYKIYVESRMD